MNRLIIILIGIFLISACKKNGAGKSENHDGTKIKTPFGDEQEIFDLADTIDLKKISPQRGQLNVDSLVFTSEDEYLDNQIKHPLLPFYLSYNEWKTIRCIIAINENSYWNKRMIGLVETSTKLRINLNNQEVHLRPDSLIQFEEGVWENIFRNDSISVRLLTNFKKGDISRSLTGKGKIEIQINDKVYIKSGFFVAKIK